MGRGDWDLGKKGVPVRDQGVDRNNRGISEVKVLYQPVGTIRFLNCLYGGVIGRMGRPKVLFSSKIMYDRLEAK